MDTKFSGIWDFPRFNISEQTKFHISKPKFGLYLQNEFKILSEKVKCKNMQPETLRYFMNIVVALNNNAKSTEMQAVWFIELYKHFCV